MTTEQGRVAFAERVEWLALQGAQHDTRPDKSDWIRVWAAARSYQGRAATPDMWAQAVVEHGDPPVRRSLERIEQAILDLPRE